MAKRRPEWVRKAAERAEKRSSGEHPMDDTEEAPVHSPIIDPPESKKPLGYKFGRPTLYRPEMCQTVIDLGAEGKSRAQIARELGICRATMMAWENLHEDFLNATQKAEYLALAWWEDQGQSGIWGGKQFNSPAYALQMRNRFPKDYAREAQPEQGGNVFVNLWQAISEKKAEPIKLIADDSQPTSEAA